MRGSVFLCVLHSGKKKSRNAMKMKKILLQTMSVELIIKDFGQQQAELRQHDTTKEPYICEKVPYISAKELCISRTSLMRYEC